MLVEYKGEEATITVTSTSEQPSIVPGLCALVDMYSCLPPPQPDWGYYSKRGSVCGIPICCYQDVEEQTIRITQQILTDMLRNVDDSIVARMKKLGMEIAIISRKQYTTDIPAHWYLKGRKTGDGREYDEETRGLGATVSCPVMSVGEECVLMSEDSKYPSESILVHEFAHAVMNLGLWKTPLLQSVHDAFNHAIAKGLYKEGSYVASNAQEYWAEMSQAWFHATIREDVTSGVTTRRAVKRRDPRLAEILATVWGRDGTWLYPQSAPAKFTTRKKRKKSLWRRIWRFL